MANQTYLLSLSLLLATLSACNGAPPATLPKIAPSEVRTLLFWKNDPVSGEKWSAEFTRSENQLWKIQSAGVGVTLSDSLAKSSLLNHLLDAMTTLEWEPPPPGAPESFGLNPPRILVKLDGKQEWKWGEAPHDGERYFLNQDKVGISKGAALGILEQFHSLNDLREHQFLVFPNGFSKDDVDELFWNSIHARREGDGWKTPGEKTVPHSDQILDALSELTISQFLEGPHQIQAKLKFSKKPFVIKLQGRNLKLITIAIDSTHSLGKIQNRGETLFQVEKAQILQLIKLGSGA